jgi:hypothetical protein
MDERKSLVTARNATNPTENFGKDFLLPIAGYQHDKYWSLDNEGVYRSSSSKASQSYRLTIDGQYDVKTNSYNTSYPRDHAFSVRCFKNTSSDLTPPVIHKVEKNPSLPTPQSVTVTVTATDNVALHATAYSFDDGKTRQSDSYKTFTENQMLTIWVRDQMGNRSFANVTIDNIQSTTYSGCNQPDLTYEKNGKFYTISACNV